MSPNDPTLPEPVRLDGDDQWTATFARVLTDGGLSLVSRQRQARDFYVESVVDLSAAAVARLRALLASAPGAAPPSTDDARGDNLTIGTPRYAALSSVPRAAVERLRDRVDAASGSRLAGAEAAYGEVADLLDALLAPEPPARDFDALVREARAAIADGRLPREPTDEQRRDFGEGQARLAQAESPTPPRAPDPPAPPPDASAFVPSPALFRHMATYDGPEHFAWSIAAFFRAGDYGDSTPVDPAHNPDDPIRDLGLSPAVEEALRAIRADVEAVHADRHQDARAAVDGLVKALERTANYLETANNLLADDDDFPDDTRDARRQVERARKQVAAGRAFLGVGGGGGR